MNILIIISFIIIIGSSVILLMPRKIAIRIAGINRFDSESIPYRYVLWVGIVASILLIVFVGVLIFELKGIISPVPAFIETILEWLGI